MESRAFLYISLLADILIAVSKFVGAAFTGSSSMMAEAVHSVIDAVSQLLLIWGVKRSKRPADAARPFGYGRELYYWSLIVSLVIFIMGGCISIYEGIWRIRHPVFDGDPKWNYIILGIAFLFNFISMLSALKAFNAQRKSTGFWRALIKTKDPSTMIVLLGDIGDLIGLVIAFLGIFIGRLLQNASIDGYASVAIGLLLLIISGFLIRESKSLLLGESISPRARRGIISLAEQDTAISKVKGVASIYRSPEDAMVMVSARFKDNLSMTELKAAIDRVTRHIQKDFPQVKQVVISPV
ncbi:cation diffusion facilitator family transporter [Mucilaginibacter corticis]|uniref:Cation diffusion facilitator family transporter n=1 Tax=Mucilaginibacter corticis TaxID=2597670 RepID=A0A556MM21_9SPHI|nr:cation diffusion facilitator family transporter [Mucilaginibacter corticis]TSJ40977.1 cation diffusion facilitator family transporter [Mucilaginibacter corticis]